jgi:hypothetical protein
MLRRLLCRIGIHGPRAGKGSLITRPSTEWCTRCGATWQIGYDGMGLNWWRRYDLSFGKPASRGEDG